MNRVVSSMFLAIVTLFLSQVSMADDFTPIFVFCSDSWGVPSDEGFFGVGDYCYKIEVNCEGDVSGGFLWGGLGIDGHIGGHMESVAGPPGPVGPVPSCAIEVMFHHWQNSKFEHSCSYDDFGKFELEAKRVPVNKCY